MRGYTISCEENPSRWWRRRRMLIVYGVADDCISVLHTELLRTLLPVDPLLVVAEVELREFEPAAFRKHLHYAAQFQCWRLRWIFLKIASLEPVLDLDHDAFLRMTQERRCQKGVRRQRDNHEGPHGARMRCMRFTFCGTDEHADPLGDALRWVARRSLIFGGQRAAGQPQLARPLSRLLPSAGPHPVYLPVAGRRAHGRGGSCWGNQFSVRDLFLVEPKTKIREENKNLGKTFPNFLFSSLICAERRPASRWRLRESLRERERERERELY